MHVDFCFKNDLTGAVWAVEPRSLDLPVDETRVRMYVRVYVCMHVCMWPWTCQLMKLGYACMYVCMYACMYVGRGT